MEVAEKAKIKIVFTIGFALMMAVGANCFFYLPFTPVPFTLQVLTVLLGAIVLGFPYSFYSQLIYLSLGFMGMGVFAGFKNAYIALAGPTAGYIMGFLAASFVSSYIYTKTGGRKGLILSLSAGLLSIYILGYGHMLIYFWGPDALSLKAVATTFKLAVAPFIVADIIKVLLVANIVNRWSTGGNS
ncbi:MAG: biotin transporter BioY [Actinomycetia bacterium]|nr:biotin transporter BioY [Actinomycetes bacterium]